MKAIICIIMLVLMPFMVFAQDYILTLKSSRDTISCDVLGASNGYLYYQTPSASLVVVPISSIKCLYLGKSDLAPRLLAGQNIPLKPDILAFIPTLPDSILAVNNANLIQQQQVNELRGIKYSLQVITAFTLASAAALIFTAAKTK
jgi:hypothetical protein